MALNVLGIEVGQKDDEPGKMPTINIPKKGKVPRKRKTLKAATKTDSHPPPQLQNKTADERAAQQPGQSGFKNALLVTGGRYGGGKWLIRTEGTTIKGDVLKDLDAGERAWCVRVVGNIKIMGWCRFSTDEPILREEHLQRAGIDQKQFDELKAELVDSVVKARKEARRRVDRTKLIVTLTNLTEELPELRKVNTALQGEVNKWKQSYEAAKESNEKASPLEMLMFVLVILLGIMYALAETTDLFTPTVTSVFDV